MPSGKSADAEVERSIKSTASGAPPLPETPPLPPPPDPPLLPPDPEAPPLAPDPPDPPPPFPAEPSSPSAHRAPSGVEMQAAGHGCGSPKPLPSAEQVTTLPPAHAFVKGSHTLPRTLSFGAELCVGALGGVAIAARPAGGREELVLAAAPACTSHHRENQNASEDPDPPLPSRAQPALPSIRHAMILSNGLQIRSQDY